MATQPQQVLNQRFALRKWLKNTTYHTSQSSIPVTALTPEKEPDMRPRLAALAAALLQDPTALLVDTYSESERKKDWAALVSKAVLNPDGTPKSLDARSRPGHKILDHHMRHFYDVKNWKGQSVRDCLTQAALEKALFSNLRMHSTPYKSEIRRMLILSAGLGHVTKYRAAMAKAIVQTYKAKRVLDPCVGWGGRLLGTLAADPQMAYVGCEPDPQTYKALQAILQDTALPANIHSRVTLYAEPVENVLARLQAQPPFDLILTSPPYFNLEVYTGGPQSTTAYPTWTEWVDKWLKPVILGCLTCLKPGGTSCWSVKNFQSDQKYNLATLTQQIHEAAGWKLVKTFTMKGSGRPGAKRIQDGKETRQSEEDTYCFQKI